MNRFSRVWISTIVGLGMLAVPSISHAVVAKRVISADKVPSRQVLQNTSFENRAEGRLAAWTFWDTGYEVTEGERHSGRGSIVCRLADEKTQRGASQVIELNQRVPTAISATGWSKASDISGSPDSGYSIYLDLEFQDGTPLWGQTGNFNTGTHDWEKRTVVLMPTKPIKQITVHAIFRGHTGVAYFDDFELRELQSPPGAGSFDGVYVVPETGSAPRPTDWVTLTARKDFKLQVSPSTGLMSLNDGMPGGGVLLRDVTADSDFHRMTGTLRKVGGEWCFDGEVASLGLTGSVTFSQQEQALRAEATVRDPRGTIRAISAYFVVPVEATRWFDDPRRSRLMEPKTEYRNTVPDGAGARGYHSLYPLGCVAKDGAGTALAMPLDVPRLSRFAYNAGSKELFAGFDFALTPATLKFPSSASFSLVLYPADGNWGMRSALNRFYSFFPDHFKKRVAHEGLWQAFADISHVEKPEDFGFAIKEGNDNVAWDDAHDILTFVYTEPMTYWQTLAKETPRTYQASVDYLEDQAKSSSAGTRDYALAAKVSSAREEDGRYSLSIQNAPWCDGAVYCMNADPGLATGPAGFNKGTYELRNIERSFETSPSQLADWNGYGSGYSLDATVRHGGDHSLSCESKEAGNQRGASQHVFIGQTEAAPLVLSGWSKAEGVTGEKDNSYCLYADLVLSDGSNLWGQVAAFDVGTHDWQRQEVTIRPEKPVRSATLHCLFRSNHTGKVWFDDLYLGPMDSKNNLLKTADFESVSNVRPVLDGTYIDSLEGWSNVKNFNPEHFAAADIPLTFDPQSKKPMILTITSTYEFAKELHDRMRAKGKLMMANAMLHGYSFFAWLMDVMGTETNWNPGNHWQPMSDAELLFKRSLCYQKPYCFLQNTHFEDFTYGLTEKYVQRCLFYGMFPGFFSENAATDHYFENPRWYNATRPLFKRYVPLIQAIAAAGWQPVTCAASDQETVLVERYGVPGKKLYLTVLNDSSQSREVTVSIESKSLALTKEGVKDLVTGGVPAVLREAGRWQLKDQLKAEEVRLYCFE